MPDSVPSPLVPVITDPLRGPSTDTPALRDVQHSPIPSVTATSSLNGSTSSGGLTNSSAAALPHRPKRCRVCKSSGGPLTRCARCRHYFHKGCSDRGGNALTDAWRCNPCTKKQHAQVDERTKGPLASPNDAVNRGTISSGIAHTPAALQSTLSDLTRLNGTPSAKGSVASDGAAPSSPLTPLRATPSEGNLLPPPALAASTTSAQAPAANTSSEDNDLLELTDGTEWARKQGSRHGIVNKSQHSMQKSNLVPFGLNKTLWAEKKRKAATELGLAKSKHPKTSGQRRKSFNIDLTEDSASDGSSEMHNPRSPLRKTRQESTTKNADQGPSASGKEFVQAQRPIPPLAVSTSPASVVPASPTRKQKEASTVPAASKHDVPASASMEGDARSNIDQVSTSNKPLFTSGLKDFGHSILSKPAGGQQAHAEPVCLPAYCLLLHEANAKSSNIGQEPTGNKPLSSSGPKDFGPSILAKSAGVQQARTEPVCPPANGLPLHEAKVDSSGLIGSPPRCPSPARGLANSLKDVDKNTDTDMTDVGGEEQPPVSESCFDPSRRKGHVKARSNSTSIDIGGRLKSRRTESEAALSGRAGSARESSAKLPKHTRPSRSMHDANGSAPNRGANQITPRPMSMSEQAPKPLPNISLKTFFETVDAKSCEARSKPVSKEAPKHLPHASLETVSETADAESAQAQSQRAQDSQPSRGRSIPLRTNTPSHDATKSPSSSNKSRHDTPQTITMGNEASSLHASPQQRSPLAQIETTTSTSFSDQQLATLLGEGPVPTAVTECRSTLSASPQQEETIAYPPFSYEQLATLVREHPVPSTVTECTSTPQASVCAVDNQARSDVTEDSGEKRDPQSLSDQSAAKAAANKRKFDDMVLERLKQRIGRPFQGPRAPRSPPKRDVPLAEIECRPTRKQLIRMGPDWTRHGRNTAVAAIDMVQKCLRRRTPPRAAAMPQDDDPDASQYIEEAPIHQEFNSFEDMFDIPQNMQPMVFNNQLVFVDGGNMSVTGRSRRPKQYFHIGIEAKRRQ